MKAPRKRKYPRRPRMPKGGLKTERQLAAYQEKVKAFNAKVSDIENDFARKNKIYEDFRKKIVKAKDNLGKIRKKRYSHR